MRGVLCIARAEEIYEMYIMCGFLVVLDLVQCQICIFALKYINTRDGKTVNIFCVCGLLTSYITFHTFTDQRESFYLVVFKSETHFC